MTAMKKKDKTLNVPHLRFPEFSGEWETGKIKQVCDIATGNKNTQDKSDDGIYPFYVRSQTVERINSWSFDGEAILTAGDGVGVGKVFHYSTGKIGVHQRVYILSNFTCDSKYLFHYFSSRFYTRVKRMSAKNSVDSVRMEMIADMPIYLASKDEQRKIGYLLSLLNERIETQRKIIDKYESLIKGIRCNLLKFDSSVRICKLKDICKITTGKLDANAMEENGIYPFFTCAEEPFTINTYTFDTEALLVSGNGANVGYVNYCNGKFNAYQRTYVLYDFSVDIHYVKYYMNAFLKQRIDQEKNIGNTPYIVLSTLADMKICIPPPARQLDICRVIKALDTKFTVEKGLYNSHQQVKDFLLRTMFI